ncbi:hypothetical protein [Pseudoalteromonas sp. NSLLW218]|uniref:hypothetical protein n=1 Tax=Pseudoalteromonas sp. NSLLW218 TaxID=2792048 RepID=UPI0018CE44D1|nr:hypothetical protein [Pseudoalteromonas sp. NSLLW218]MBH0090419.1 hypothetical protein [Pseudoalteromonas sp. NSLLW218]
MKIFFLVVNSLLGTFFVCIGLVALTINPLSGVFSLICGLFLLPPVRYITHRATKIKVSTKHRVIICLTAFFLSGVADVYQGRQEVDEYMASFKQRQKEEDKKNITFFNNNRESVIQDIKNKVSDRDLKAALLSTEKYLVTGDSEIKQLYDEIDEVYEPAKEYIGYLSESEKAEAIASLGEPPSNYPFIGYPVITNYLEGILNDPNSLEMEKCGDVYKGQYGWLVSCSFRAKNGFGALVKSEKWFVIRKDLVMFTHEYDYFY